MIINEGETIIFYDILFRKWAVILFNLRSRFVRQCESCLCKYAFERVSYSVRPTNQNE